MEPLTAYEIERTPLAPLPPETCVPVPTQVREELRCMICFEILREAKAVADCLHRFCKDCAELTVRKFAAFEGDSRSQPASRRKQSGGAECPLCRTNIASRRDLYDDRHFQSLVGVIFPHVAADEAAEQRALEESTKQYQSALLLGSGQDRNARVAPGASPQPRTAPAAPPSTAAAATDEQEQEEEEEEDETPLDPAIAGLKVCFALRPLPAAAVGAVMGVGAGPQALVLPSVGDRKLFRAMAGAKVAALKHLLAKRLALPRPSHLELCCLIPSSSEQQPVVVVVDGALTLADVVMEVWGQGGEVSEELVLYYCLRGPAEAVAVAEEEG